MATGTGFEPVISAVTGQRVDHYTNRPLNVLGTGTPDPLPTFNGGDADNRSPSFDSVEGRDPAFESVAHLGIDQVGVLTHVDVHGIEHWTRHEEPHIRGSLPTMNAEQTARFWSRVDQSGGFDACWPWMKGKTREGYGMFKIGKRNYPAHRIAYMLVHGAPEPHLEIDHLCDNPPCCNPGPLHHRAVTHQQNLARSLVTTTCKYGHEGREYRKRCVICFSEKRRAKYAAQKASA